MSRSTRVLALVGASLALAPAAHAAPGATGVGDPYFPLEGNGGYDARHYDLRLAYDPSSDRLDGVATMSARALEDLSSVDLDLQQLDVRWVTVDGRRAGFTRDGQELTITPRHRLHRRSRFRVSVGHGGGPGAILRSPTLVGAPDRVLPTHHGHLLR